MTNVLFDTHSFFKKGDSPMKKLLIAAALLVSLSACSGTRGTIGGQKVCTNDYLLGVISLSEIVSPCGK